MDRAGRRAERARIAYAKAAQKEALLAASAEAARQYEDVIQALTESHRVTLQMRDWRALATEARVLPPERSSVLEDAARRTLEAYRPGWWARTFGFEASKRQKLTQAIAAAATRDEADFQDRIRRADARNAEIDFAGRVLASDHDAVVSTLTHHSGLGALPYSLSAVKVVFGEAGRLVAVVDGLDLEDIPTESVTLLQSGRASFKAIAKGRVMELQRDNICSSAIRVAVEFVQALARDEIEVVMHTNLLDPATGRIGREPVLYLRATAQALGALNLPRTEPSAVIDRLGGHCSWSKRDGFRAVNLGPFAIPDHELTAEDF